MIWKPLFVLLPICVLQTLGWPQPEVVFRILILQEFIQYIIVFMSKFLLLIQRE
jgi:hypothetical protein